MEAIDSNKEYLSIRLDYYFKRAKENGISLLIPKSREEKHAIYNYIAEIENFIVFPIGPDNDRTLVIRYKSHKYSENNVIRGMANKAFSNFKKGNYLTAIKLYKRVLEAANKIHVELFAEIGLCYLHLGIEDVARDYLFVAQTIDPETYQFDEEIQKVIAGDIEQQPMSTEFIFGDIRSENLEYYGINDANKIIDEVLSGVKLEEATSELSLPDKLLIMLLLAKEYYKIGFVAYGDIYLKGVERSKEKTSFIRRELSKIRANKKIYQRQSTEDQISLILNKKTGDR